uniref:SP-RING-type domain-containing protein n=1 Tax=Calidris pygmaea TaxID=425635 RepID=A0A8C3JBI1_9CHAR
MRLTIPCRAVTCTHLQCFDAALYLQMNEKKPTWICPVCDKKAAYESLILDGVGVVSCSLCCSVKLPLSQPTSFAFFFRFSPHGCHVVLCCHLRPNHNSPF